MGVLRGLHPGAPRLRPVPMRQMGGGGDVLGLSVASQLGPKPSGSV